MLALKQLLSCTVVKGIQPFLCVQSVPPEQSLQANAKVYIKNKNAECLHVMHASLILLLCFPVGR